MYFTFQTRTAPRRPAASEAIQCPPDHLEDVMAWVAKVWRFKLENPIQRNENPIISGISQVCETCIWLKVPNIPTNLLILPVQVSAAEMVPVNH